MNDEGVWSHEAIIVSEGNVSYQCKDLQYFRNPLRIQALPVNNQMAQIDFHLILDTKSKGYFNQRIEAHDR